MNLDEKLEALVARCIEHLDDGDAEAVEAILADNAEHATVLRRRLGDLERLGLLRDESSRLDADVMPETLGPFRLLTSLGRGGMGEVYVAEQTEPIQRRVAIKFVRSGRGSREATRRFAAERQVLARMTDPRIAKVLEVGATDDGRQWLAMELVEGESITSYCENRAATLQDRLALFVEVCRAVQHAHEQGVIHRDLKPANVLVSEASDRPEIRLIDFGIAKIFDVDGCTSLDGEDGDALTISGTMLGTPEYMSPEQAAGLEDKVDPRADVYSLGVLLYEIVTGVLPFASERLRRVSTHEIVRILAEEEPRLPSRATTRTSSKLLRGDLDAIIAKAIEKRPEARYASVRDFADDVDRYLASKPILARPPSTVQRLGKLWRRRRAACVAVIVATLGVASGGGAWLAGQFEVRKSRERFQMLAVAAQIDDAFEVAAAIRPPWPSKIPEFEAWFADFEAPLLELEPRVVATCVELRDDEASLGGDERFLLRLLEKARDDYEPLLRAPDSTRAKLKKDLAWARELAGRSEQDAPLWERVRAEMDAEPRYGGLRITPQSGLVPLGRDPRSGLQEFAHLRSGALPKRARDGQIRIRGKHGIVFVLVPSGRWQLGAQDKDPIGPNYDPHAFKNDGPVRTVESGAFFLSKYETTQGQWQRLAGMNPSLSYAGKVMVGGEKPSWSNPVENVQWRDAVSTLERFGLDLPSDEEWEIACRAGTQSVWPTGDEVTSLEGHANLGDRTLQKWRRQNGADYDAEPWTDGWIHHAPVGLFAPNAFGFHDMIGNVNELCWRDRGAAGKNPLTPYPVRDRGGSAASRAAHARSGMRFDRSSLSGMFQGLRVARPIERP